MTLNHGVFLVWAGGNLSEAKTILDTWPPDMAIVDMDHDDSSDLLMHLGVGVELVEHDAQMATEAGLRLVHAQVDRARRIGDDVASPSRTVSSTERLLIRQEQTVESCAPSAV